MKIRKFELDDLDQVMKIWLDGNLAAHDFVPKKYWLDHFDEVREELKHADILVAEEDGQVAGFVGMQGDYLAGIFVDKKFQHHGIGKRLLNEIKQSHESFSLNVYAKNTPALSFYKKQGLEIVKRQVDEFGNEDCLMAWKKENKKRITNK